MEKRSIKNPYKREENMMNYNLYTYNYILRLYFMSAQIALLMIEVMSSLGYF